MIKKIILCRESIIGSKECEDQLINHFKDCAAMVITESNIQTLESVERLLAYLYDLHFKCTKNQLSDFTVYFERFNANILELLKPSETIVIHSTEIVQYQDGQTLIQQYKRGANGGTFDYLHFGHKILLSVSLIVVSQHLTIGVTADQLLQKKKLKAFIQSYETRAKVVQQFCTLFRPEIEIYTAPLNDPAGPTKDGDYEVLIATKETEGALEYINNLRVGLKQLEKYVIGLLQDQTDKISSSYIRQFISDNNRLDEQQFLYLKSKWLLKDAFWFENSIVRHYSESQRRYHTLYHLYELFRGLEAVQIHNPQIVHFAIFFHDVIYNPKRNDNEHLSNELFKLFAAQYQEIEDPESISYFIMQTQHMAELQQQLMTPDLEHFLDLDLSILNSEPQRYQQYAQDIRFEYQHISDENYRQGRGAVLRMFLKKERLYHHLDDHQARLNIEDELSRL